MQIAADCTDCFIVTSRDQPGTDRQASERRSDFAALFGIPALPPARRSARFTLLRWSLALRVRRDTAMEVVAHQKISKFKCGEDSCSSSTTEFAGVPAIASGR